MQTTFRPKLHGFRFRNSFSFSHVFELPLVGEVELGDVTIGLCGGMCFAALDYFHAARPVPTQVTVPAAGSALRRYLSERQVHSLIPPEGVLKVLQWTAADDRYVAGRTAGREFRKLRSRLDAGQPAVLALIRVKELGEATKNHQVVAWAYELNPASQALLIRLYDPNHPLAEPSLRMNFANPAAGIDPSQSTGERLRGWFVIDYRPRTVP